MTTVVTNGATTTITAPDRLHFLDDYCIKCNPLGHHCPDRRARLRSLTEPTALVRRGSGNTVLLEYRCGNCGHRWRRSDLWDARSAGLEVAA